MFRCAHCIFGTRQPIQINIETRCKHWPSVVRQNKMSKYTNLTETEEPLVWNIKYIHIASTRHNAMNIRSHITFEEFQLSLHSKLRHIV